MNSVVNDFVNKYTVGKFRIDSLPSAYAKALRFYYKNFETRRYNPGELVTVLNIPTRNLKDAILACCVANQYNSFEEYHNDYKKDHVLKAYDDIFPIILDHDFNCIIEDGWNRFHSYVELGITLIPCIV